MPQSQIAEILGRVGMLDERQIDAVLSRASGAHSGGYVVVQVAELGYASESAVARAISIELGLPRIDLTMTPPEAEALALLDGHACMDRLVLPVALRENGELLWLAMADPTDAEAMNFVRRKTNRRVRPAVTAPSEIMKVAKQHYGVVMPRMSSAKGEHDLGAIDAGPDDGEVLEVVNVMDESASPLARLAAQLGVEVPRNAPSEDGIEVVLDDPEDTQVDLRPPVHGMPIELGRMTPPHSKKARPEKAAAPAEQEFEINLADAPAADELSPDELRMLEQISQSLEKQAHVLKTLVALCLEKGIFTREEMARRKRE